MLFPIIDLDYVVPPVLHIYLGIILRLFNLVEQNLRTLDGTTTTAAENERNDTLVKRLE